MEFPGDFKTWQSMASCLRMWDLDARGFHKSMWRFWLKKNHVLVIGCPASVYCSYKPAEIKPLYIPRIPPVPRWRLWKWRFFISSPKIFYLLYLFTLLMQGLPLVHLDRMTCYILKVKPSSTRETVATDIGLRIASENHHVLPRPQKELNRNPF